MELIASLRPLVGITGLQTHHLARVRVAAGAYEYCRLSGRIWAREVFRQAKSDDVEVFIHGYNTSHAEFVARFQRIRRGIQKASFKGEVVGFEWPSRDQLAAYPDDLKLAEAAAPHLVDDCIRVLQKAKPKARVHILAHSMGSLLLAQGLVKRPLVKGALGEILFVASDVARRDMREGQTFADTLSGAGRRLTNYRSMRDQVLDLSQKLFNGGQRRAGRHGVDGRAHTDVNNVSCSLRYFTFVEPRDRIASKSHNFYFDDARFFKDAVQTLLGKPASKITTRSNRPNGELQIKP